MGIVSAAKSLGLVRWWWDWLKPLLLRAFVCSLWDHDDEIGGLESYYGSQGVFRVRLTCSRCNRARRLFCHNFQG